MEKSRQETLAHADELSESRNDSDDRNYSGQLFFACYVDKYRFCEPKETCPDTTRED